MILKCFSKSNHLALGCFRFSVHFYKCLVSFSPQHHPSSFTWSSAFSSRSTLPSSSRLYNKAASSLNPWALTLASSPTPAAILCPPLTRQCPPMSSSTHWPAWPCSPPPSHLLRSQWLVSLSRMPQVCVTALAEKMTNYTPSGMSWITDLCFPVDSAGSQDLSHVMSSSGLIAGGTGGQEITLTINNPSLTQALASASCSSAAAGNPQEITLTISGMDHFINKITNS